MRKAIVACVFVSLFAGCVGAEDRKTLALEQATTDLRCAGDRLAARRVGERSFETSGCGRRATYKVICKLTVSSCYLIGGPDT